MVGEKQDLIYLSEAKYDIAGNVFRTWHDGDNNLICVLDETVDEGKENALLVVRSDGNRKWDDILVNDYAMDVDVIRPRKDNKYQKIDIEYDGLDAYQNLIDAYELGKDLTTALDDFYDFRDAAVRRSAAMRLGIAQEIIDQATETIRKTNATIAVHKERKKRLQEKLKYLRENIGREPTKESASKILRVEAQIEKIKDRIERAEKRIANARHRIETAQEDADAARKLIDFQRKPEVVDVVVKEKEDNNAVEFVPEIESEKEEEKMADSEEVKPLFNEDPEILDEEIAFKPVAFDDIKSTAKPARPASPLSDSMPVAQQPAEEKDDDSEIVPTDKEMVEAKDESVTEPLKFSSIPLDEYEDVEEPDEEEFRSVLNAIKSVDKPVGADVDPEGQVSAMQYDNVPEAVTRESEEHYEIPESYSEDNTSVPVAPVSQPEPEPVRPVAQPAAASYTRPISPITGTSHGVAQPVGGDRSHPTFIYYLLLIVLIVLSIFTLWLYQKKNGDTLPIIEPEPTVVVSEQEPQQAEPPFVEPEPELIPEPEPEVIPEPIPEPEPEQPQQEPAPTADAPIKIEYPNADVLKGAQPTETVVESEDDVLARKQPYGVSQQDKTVQRVTTVQAPDIIFEDDIISVPVRSEDYVEYYSDNVEVVNQEPDLIYQDNVGYVQDTGYYDEQEYYDEPREPETTQHLSIHDGGQYSIKYKETRY